MLKKKNPNIRLLYIRIFIMEGKKLEKTVTIKKRKQCSNGTKRNKEGNCEPITNNKNISILDNDSNENVKDVKTLIVRENKKIPLISSQLALEIHSLSSNE